MASETVDPIDWPLPPTLDRAVPPELHLHMQMRAYKSQDLLHSLGREHAISGTQGHRISYAATQGSRVSRHYSLVFYSVHLTKVNVVINTNSTWRQF